MSANWLDIWTVKGCSGVDEKVVVLGLYGPLGILRKLSASKNQSRYESFLLAF